MSEPLLLRTRPPYVCELQQSSLCCSPFLFYFCFSPSVDRIYSRMLISACCATNLLAGSLLPASNSAFNYHQPEAGCQLPSRFIHTGSCAPNSVCLQSSCNPTPKLTSVSSCFHHLSFTLCFPASLYGCIVLNSLVFISRPLLSLV